MDIWSVLTHGNWKRTKGLPRQCWSVCYFVLILDLGITAAEQPTAENILVSCLTHPEVRSSQPYLWIQTDARHRPSPGRKYN